MKPKPILRKSRYLYLLLSLVTYFVSLSFLVDFKMEGGVETFLFSLILLFSLYSILRRKIILLVATVLALLSFVGNGLASFGLIGEEWMVIQHIASILFLSVIICSVISDLLSHKKVTLDTLLGAISGYLLIGFLWTFFYMLLTSLNPDAFSGLMLAGSKEQKVQHFIYYSFITLTTVGYGDILAISSVARTLSWVEAIVGQAYLTIWIAGLVGLHILHRQKDS